MQFDYVRSLVQPTGTAGGMRAMALGGAGRQRSVAATGSGPSADELDLRPSRKMSAEAMSRKSSFVNSKLVSPIFFTIHLTPLLYGKRGSIASKIRELGMSLHTFTEYRDRPRLCVCVCVF